MKREIINSDYEMRPVALRELQSAAGEELRRRRTLLPSVLDRAFRGEWSRIRNDQLGVSLRRQHAIGNYIPDFCSPKAKLIIELA